MPTDVIPEKQQVHALVDRLAPSQVTAVRGLLEVMLDPVARAIANAPMDDEPATSEDLRRFREGQSWFGERGGKGIPMEEILAEFGRKPEDFSLDK